MLRNLTIFIALILAGCATGIGNGETILRKYDVHIAMDGDGN